jgi:hypothetical protein
MALVHWLPSLMPFFAIIFFNLLKNVGVVLLETVPLVTHPLAPFKSVHKAELYLLYSTFYRERRKT